MKGLVQSGWSWFIVPSLLVSLSTADLATTQVAPGKAPRPGANLAHVTPIRGVPLLLGQDSSASEAQLEKAEKELVILEHRQPKDPGTLNALGIVRFYLGQPAAAEAAFRKVIELYPDNADARAHLSYLYYSSGRDAAGDDLLREVLGLDADNYAANYYAGWNYVRRGELFRAELYLKKAAAIYPARLEAPLGLARLYAQQPQHTKEAEALLNELLRTAPNNSRVRYERGVFFGQQRRYAEAAAEFEQVLRIGPAASPVRLELAIAYFLMADYAAVVRTLQEFHKVAVTPESAYLLGHSLAEMGRLEEAISSFQKALSLRPNFFDARFQLGRAFFTENHLPEARHEFEQAVKLDEKNVEARYLLGYSQELLGDLNEAQRDYAEAARLAPDRFEGFHGLGSIALRRGDNAAAVQNLERAATLNSRSDDVQYLLGLALQRAGRWEEAAEAFKTSMTLNALRVDAHYHYGQVLRRLGRTAEADAEFRLVERLNAEFRQRRASGSAYREPR